MKNTIYKLLCLCFLFSASSCNDALDILPVDQVAAEDALTTPEDIDLALSGAFAGYSPQLIIQFSSRFGDDLRIGVDNGGQGVNDINQVLDSNSAIAVAIFSSYYNVINRCNRILEAINTNGTSGLSDEQIQRLAEIEGQALTLRALAHFDLLTFYAPSFNDSDLGIPYIDFVVTLELPARNTVGEVFDAIQADLDIASGLITGTSNRFFTTSFITALQAKIALFRGNNQEAIMLSNQVIADFPLANRSEYLDMYLDNGPDPEVIFRVSRTVTDARIGGLFYFTGTGGAFLEMSFGLFSALDPADVRFDVLVDDDLDGGAIDPVSNPPTTIFIKKYPGRDGQFGLNDIKMYRVSEQYFILAEAQAKTGDLLGAAATLDILRDARYGSDQPAPTFNTLAEAINAILTERRLELAYEGHRFLDIKRTRDITGNGVIRNEMDCGGATPCALLPDDFRFTLPIPQGEIDVNPNIIQNDGYDTN